MYRTDSGHVRQERHQVREKRKLEDMAWKMMRANRKEEMLKGCKRSGPLLTGLAGWHWTMFNTLHEQAA